MTTGVIGMVVIYSELYTVRSRKIISCCNLFGPKKAAFISGLIDLTVIDIAQQGCPELADKFLHHPLYICMSRQVQIRLCIAISLFISAMADL
jgi:hypothetical protein